MDEFKEYRKMLPRNCVAMIERKLHARGISKNKNRIRNHFRGRVHDPDVNDALFSVVDAYREMKAAEKKFYGSLDLK